MRQYINIQQMVIAQLLRSYPPPSQHQHTTTTIPSQGQRRKHAEYTTDEYSNREGGQSHQQRQGRGQGRGRGRGQGRRHRRRRGNRRFKHHDEQRRRWKHRRRKRRDKGGKHVVGRRRPHRRWKHRHANTRHTCGGKSCCAVYPTTHYSSCESDAGGGWYSESWDDAYSTSCDSGRDRGREGGPQHFDWEGTDEEDDTPGEADFALHAGGVR